VGTNFQEGQRYAFSITVGKEDVIAFAELSGDKNPLHIDEEYCALTELKRPVVHGILINSYISRMIGMSIPGAGALWLKQSIEFRHPVFYNDTIEICAKIEKINHVLSVMSLSFEVINQMKITVLTGSADVKFLKKKKK
jgi:3-hydroxybutyryl-CoA dehydratase